MTKLLVMSTHMHILPTAMASKVEILVAISTTIASTTKYSSPFTMDHNFLVLKTNIILCFHILKYEPSNFGT